MHTILAVDDSPSMRQMVAFTLKNAGFNVVEAVDGQDAFEKSTQRDYNLVLTDQNMPRMDGISLTKKLRENPKFKQTPILRPDEDGRPRRGRHGLAREAIRSRQADRSHRQSRALKHCPRARTRCKNSGSGE
jgi:response regulator RpfG family c-di-GMP phosphodiesterase